MIAVLTSLVTVVLRITKVVVFVTAVVKVTAFHYALLVEVVSRVSNGRLINHYVTRCTLVDSISSRRRICCRYDGHETTYQNIDHYYTSSPRPRVTCMQQAELVSRAGRKGQVIIIRVQHRRSLPATGQHLPARISASRHEGNCFRQGNQLHGQVQCVLELEKLI